MDDLQGWREYGEEVQASSRRETLIKELYSCLECSTRVVFPASAINTGPVNDLSIDNVRAQYMLAALGDSSIRLFDLDSYNNTIEGTTQVRELQGIARKVGHSYGVSKIDWWPFDTGMFCSSSYDGTTRIWDTSCMEEIYKFDLGSKIYSHSLSETGDHSLIATAADDPRLRLIDLRTTSFAQTLTGHQGRIVSVAWHPTYPYSLASGGSDGSVRLWDIRRSRPCLCTLDMESIVGQAQQQLARQNQFSKQTRKAHWATVNGLCWIDRGAKLVTCGNDDKIRIWDMDEPGGANTLVNFGPLVRNRFTQKLEPWVTPELPDPVLFFPSDSGEILAYSVDDGELLSRLRPPYTRDSRQTSINKRYCCIQGRADGSPQLYTGRSDGTISVWMPPPVEVPIDNMDKTQDKETNSRGVLQQIQRSIEAQTADLDDLFG